MTPTLKPPEPVPTARVYGTQSSSRHGPEIPGFLLRHRRKLVFAIQLGLVPFAYLLAFGLRFDFVVPENYLLGFLVTLPILIGLRLATFRFFGVHDGWWRHVGMLDLVALIKAVSVGTIFFGALIFVLRLEALVPRSVLLLEWGAAILCFGGVRFGVRWIREREIPNACSRGGKRTLVVGAGSAGARLIREIHLEVASGIHPVGFVDDNAVKQGWRIHGIPILGTTAEMGTLVKRHRIELVIVAIPSARREQMRRIVERCTSLGVECKIVPPLGELLDGRARLSQLRTVRVEDLLGRMPVRLDLKLVHADLRGRTVLITGGAGSIGSELARQVAAYEPAHLVLVEQAESALYFVHHELVRTHALLDVVPVIADVAHPERMESVFAEHRPDYVLHAAAYKHVPMMENNVPEAARNNILGTLCVANCAARHGARKFVLISTDKAVNPSSVMGATKRIAERIILGIPELRQSSTDFRAVRFGNVLGSDGSVVPLFRRQIEAGGPVTVTDPEVTRFFMTIPEAVQLVLQAAAAPEASQRIAMLEMGEPVKILTLAENMIRLSGLEPYTEMPIIFTGLRQGEKLYEELMSEVEKTVPTSIEKVHIVQTDEGCELALQAGLKRLTTSLNEADVSGLLEAICALVPECVAPLRERVSLGSRHQREVERAPRPHALGPIAVSAR